jgi:hypothetical protein
MGAAGREEELWFINYFYKGLENAADPTLKDLECDVANSASSFQSLGLAQK